MSLPLSRHHDTRSAAPREKMPDNEGAHRIHGEITEVLHLAVITLVFRPVARSTNSEAIVNDILPANRKEERIVNGTKVNSCLQLDMSVSTLVGSVAPF